MGNTAPYANSGGGRLGLKNINYLNFKDSDFVVRTSFVALGGKRICTDLQKIIR